LQSCGQDKFWAPQSSNLKVRPARDIFNHSRLPDAGESLRISDGPDIDHLAEAGPLDPDLVDAIAEAITASHDIAPLAPAEPWLASIPGIIEGNTTVFREAACFPTLDIENLRQASRSAFSTIRGLLEQRGERRYVRHCHGDLHLANIVLIDRKPVMFDAIEFDPDIASVDVFYDLAFAVMDFIRYGRQAAANALLNRYLALTASENLDALAALPLFMSLRAAIRSNVHAALKYLRKAQRSLGQLNDDANSRSLAAALKRDSINVPLRFLTRKREKHLIQTAAAAYQKLAQLKPPQIQLQKQG
jgi:aminoglycoside phosphotransferase family enzyme